MSEESGFPDIGSVRKYWDKSPCNIRHSPAPVGTREWADAVEARKYFVESHLPAFAEFEKWRGKKVLELGLGIATDAVNFARAGADYYGLELSKQSLDIASERFAVFGLRGKFFLWNAEDDIAQILPGPFDLVYSFGVLHHTPNPRRVLDAVHKLMTSDSELRLMLYAANSWKAAMIEAGLDQPEAQAGCPIAKTYTHDEIRDLLHGFDILELRQTHIFPYNVDKYRTYEYVKEPWFAAMPPQMFNALERRFGWHTLIRAKKR